MKKANRIYVYSTAAFMFVLPIGSICVAAFTSKRADLWSLVGEWFVFWSVGGRLLVAGIRQVAQPGFTAEQIFGIKDRESHAVVRELGLSNICFGLTGVVSLFVPSWRMAAAFAGGLYFGLAGILHVIKGAASGNERIAMFSDLGFFGLIAGWFFHAALAG